jgi:molybdopterin-synthase adenylyltransferase
MNRLLFYGGALEMLRARLLASDLESAAFVLARPVQVSDGAWRLLAIEVLHIRDADYRRRSLTGVELPPEVIAPIIKRARHKKLSVILVHTHPGEGRVGPSAEDLAGEARLLPTLFQRVPEVPHGRLIIGNTDTNAAVIGATGSETPLEVLEVGSDLVRAPSLVSSLPLDSVFARQVQAFGEDGQRTLGRFRVAIIGLGGTGSLVAQQLAHLGITKFLLIDRDVVEATNLNRVVGASAPDVGAPKVAVAQRMIRAIQPKAEVEIARDDVTRQSVARRVLNSDFFFSCTDSHGSRAVLTQLAYQFLVPGIDLGVRIEVSQKRISHVVGRVQMLAPGLACLVCGDVLDPDAVRRDLLSEEQQRTDPYIVGAGVAQPSVISLNSVMSGLAVTMFIGFVTGAPFRSRHLIVRFDTGLVKTIENRVVPECSVCSEMGFLARGDGWPMPGRPG